MEKMPVAAWDKHVREGYWEILDYNGHWIPLTASVRPNECRPHLPGFDGYYIRRVTPLNTAG